MSVLPKHKKYLNICIPGEEYWGFGIENESYIEMEGGVEVKADFLCKNRNRERYCVNYWTQYKPGTVERVLEVWTSQLPQKEETLIRLPLLLNAHTFTKCDQWGEHKTTYDVIPKVNPKAACRTLLEELANIRPDIFGEEAQNDWWTFDGDTVEFMTRNFYCAKMEDVLDELCLAKQRWMNGLREGLLQLPKREELLQKQPQWPRKNYGFAVFATNRCNVAIFNNGTYHINITMPTYLDKEGNIVDWKGFVRKHQNAARMFQWLSPLLVAKWGSPDVFANLAPGFQSFSFPTGSQRLAASRYVSIGTYDTEEMPTGKQLVESAENIRFREWWKQMYEMPTCAYNPLDVLGFDINFHKFQNHGLEFRIFDWFPGTYLKEVCRFLIWMLDASLEWKEVPVPQKRSEWNSVVQKCVWNGTSAILSKEEVQLFSHIFGFYVPTGISGIMDVLDIYNCIWNIWADRYNYKKGGCSEKMIQHPLLRPMIPVLQLRRESIPKTRNAMIPTIVRLKSPRHFLQKQDVTYISKKVNKQTQTPSEVPVISVKCCGGFGLFKTI